MNFLAYIFFFIYVFSLFFIGLYCLSQFHLLLVYLKKRSRHVELKKEEHEVEWPHVTIQLPVYNEKFVVSRLIDNIMKMDYPKEKLSVHLLDDSTDETRELSKKKVEEYKSKGFDIMGIHRTDRKGYKAGALKEAMAFIQSDYIAIFDADFMPRKDFLKKTIPVFSDPGVGVVQTRWEHLNQNLSLLTEMQALQLNVHFTVEQKGRYSGDYLLQFNGTAGVWRTKTITDAGGWEADTLTEDLDLSYRAQLKNWKIVYLEDLGAPAELPSDIQGLKSQQFRWMKGGAENARKLLKQVWNSSFDLSKKLHATSHLMSSSVFPAVLSLGISSVPLMYFVNKVNLPMHFMQVFLASFASIVILYFIVNVIVLRETKPLLWLILKFLVVFPIFMSLSMALAFHNSVAVVQGWMGKRSPFIRTPKYGVTDSKNRLGKSAYFVNGMNGIILGEVILASYFTAAMVLGIKSGVYNFTLLHAMLAFGYVSLLLYAIRAQFSK